MSAIITAYQNLLESASVTLAAGTEDADYPLYRLYDRNTGRAFRASAAETLEVRIDQGASGAMAVDRLLIPSGHNLGGMTLDLLHSGDDVTYTPATPQWTGAHGVIDKSWTPATARYWKFRITAPGAAPSLGELFLTGSYEWERQPARPSGSMDTEFNALSETTSSGEDRFLVMGLPKRRRSYKVPRCGETMRDEISALYGAWAGASPFWLRDHEGSWISGRLVSPPQLTEQGPGAWSFSFDFREVL